jgi:hypothetical protein
MLLVFLILGLGFFALSALLARLCQRLLEGGS